MRKGQGKTIGVKSKSKSKNQLGKHLRVGNTITKVCVDPTLVEFPHVSQEICRYIWEEKYGIVGERGPLDSMLRMTNAIYENDPSDTERQLALSATELGLWVPGGRIQAGSGTGRAVTLMNCYVDQEVTDSMVGIADALKSAMLTMQQGGGIGMDFSLLRPSMAYLARTASYASGPLPFMDMWDSMCSTIMSAGQRRGAMMATMLCTHPDLLQFIEAKHKAGRLTNFNVSVLVSDAFMDAVKSDDEWQLYFGVPRADARHLGTFEDDEGILQYIYSTHRARDLWDKIMKSTYEFAEPGVIFIDRVNDTNNLKYVEYIQCTNPCGEQPLPPNGACNLGAVNLARMVQNPFTPQAQFNFGLLREVCYIGTRFLDNVIDVTGYPLEAQKTEELNKRRIGLGILGLANAMMMMGIKYGTEESLSFTQLVMNTILDSTYAASALLAAERGAFPLYDPNKWAEHSIVKKYLSKETKRAIEAHGIRNGVLLTIAPTGTTALYCGNVSSGLEPVFAPLTKRKVRQADNSWREFVIKDYAHMEYERIVGHAPTVETAPALMVTTSDLSVESHVRIQAACQRYVDASISKTINCPKDITFEDFKLVYWDAYELGCKGCTTYRPSDVRGSILEVAGVPSEEASIVHSKSSSGTPEKEILPQRPEALTGTTYKIKWPSAKSAYYVTINDLNHKPFEIFIASTAATHQDWATALSLMISAIFRKGGNIAFVGEELQKVVSATDSAWLNGRYWGSLVAMVGHVIEKHVGQHQHQTRNEYQALVTTEINMDSIDPQNIIPEGAEVCPQCLAPALIRKEGCKSCISCNFSSCN
jgi:ribonucleoside-diphosphate reductase alpha chain